MLTGKRSESRRGFSSFSGLVERAGKKKVSRIREDAGTRRSTREGRLTSVKEEKSNRGSTKPKVYELRRLPAVSDAKILPKIFVSSVGGNRPFTHASKLCKKLPRSLARACASSIDVARFFRF